MRFSEPLPSITAFRERHPGRLVIVYPGEQLEVAATLLEHGGRLLVRNPVDITLHNQLPANVRPYQRKRGGGLTQAVRSCGTARPC